MNSGFDAVGEVGNFRSGNGTNGEASSSTGGLNNRLNFNSGPSSSSRFMPSIAENGNENGGTGSSEHRQLGNGNETNQGYVSGFLNDTWNDSPFNSLKRNRDGDLKVYSSFNGLENQVMFWIVRKISLPCIVPCVLVSCCVLLSGWWT